MNKMLDEETIKSYKSQIKRYELAIEYDIDIYENYWKAEALNKIIELNIEGIEESKITEKLKNNDFMGYIELQKQDKKQKLENKEITQEEYNDEMVELELKEKYNIGKDRNEEYWKTILLRDIKLAKKSLRTGINQENSKILTVEKKQEYEDKIRIDTYRLENNKPTLENTTNYREIFETLASNFVVSAIAIFAIIIAGGEISTESSTGTIKFWALTPNKRWKILTAKILSILLYILIITLVMSALTIACGNIFFTESGTEYIYVKDGNIQKIGNTLYIIESYFAKSIPVIIFALFALMLSTLTRNTAVAVSFSVATYMGNGIVMMIINQLIKSEWVKYIPFNNLNIADKLFSNIKNPIAMVSETFATSTSLQFSLAVLGICAILMLVTMYDSFNKRDII